MSLYSLKHSLRSLTPGRMVNGYHWLLAMVAAWWYGYPSRCMVVIGVTGTNGKSTTVNMIGRILERAGYRVGWTSTANVKVAEVEWLNDRKMTMLGRFATQQLLYQMKRNHCDIAVIETSSEGMKQYRHIGIDYDIAVFTNLTPEHLESHGGFENYKHAKALLFQSLSRSSPKRLKGRTVAKTIVANLDDNHGMYYLSFPAEQKIGYHVTEGLAGQTLGHLPPRVVGVVSTLIAHDIHGSTIEVDGCPMLLPIPGRFNVSNATAAIATTQAIGIPSAVARDALQAFHTMPGRMEWIDEGQPFRALIDYAPEPESLKQLYGFIQTVAYQRLIHVLGSTGGGRDRARRAVLGELAARHADCVIVTNEDPYDDDPQEIIDEVASGARAAVQPKMTSLLTILDRGEAIAKAVDIAQTGDLVLVTGKGCEQAICVSQGKKIPWDDRLVLRKAIKTRLSQPNSV